MPTFHRPLIVLTWLVALGVMAQALLAGQAWFVSPELFALHGGIGHGVLLLSVLLATFCWLASAPRLASVLATLLVIALVGQTGLGYAGRRGELAVASAAHVPLGVAVLGLAVAVAVLLSVRARGQQPSVTEPGVPAER